MSDGGKGDKRRPEDLAKFDEGYQRVFGDAKVTRGRFIYDEKQRKLVPAEEFCEPIHHGHFVIEDTKPYKSMVTGEMIEGRRAHREHLRTHGVVEVGNDLDRAKPRSSAPAPGLKETLARIAYEKLRY